MLSTVKLISFCWLINLSWCAPTMNYSTNEMTEHYSIYNIGRQPAQPNITTNLNCSCTVTIGDKKGSALTINGLSIKGQSDYRCDQGAFTECEKNCYNKTKNQPIFNVDTQSVGLNISNGVNLNDYLCGLSAKGDFNSMVLTTVQMDCTERSTSFELFNSKSSSFAVSPSTSLKCPTMTTPSIEESTTVTIS